MPYRRRFRRRYRRRRSYRRRRRYYGRRRRRYSRRSGYRLAVRKMPMYLPDAIKVPLKYTQELSFASGLNDATASYTLNVPYTHQPYGWDQWAALYDKYYCVSSFIKIECTPTGVPEARITLWPSQNLASTLGSAEQAQQQRYAKTRSVWGSSSRTILRHRMSVQKIDGFRPSGINFIADTNDALATNYTRYWNIWATDANLNDELNTLFCRVIIVYYVRFFRPTQQSTS